MADFSGFGGIMAGMLEGAANRSRELRQQSDQEKAQGHSIFGKMLAEQAAENWDTWDNSQRQTWVQNYTDHYGMDKKHAEVIMRAAKYVPQPVSPAQTKTELSPLPQMGQAKIPSQPVQAAPASESYGGISEPAQAQVSLGALPQFQQQATATPHPAEMSEIPAEVNSYRRQQLMQKSLERLNAMPGLTREQKDIESYNMMGVKGYPAIVSAQIGAQSRENVQAMKSRGTLTAGNSGQFVDYQEPDQDQPTRVFEVTKGPHAGMTFDPNTLQPKQIAAGSRHLKTSPDKIFSNIDGKGNVVFTNATKALGDDTSFNAGPIGKPSPTSTGELTPYQKASMGSRSYEARIKELDKIASPIEDRMARIDRLYTTLNAGPTGEGAAAADPEVAPELITIMAGGLGSGVRITQPEINASVGGRENWQALETALNQWRRAGDPQAGLKIDPIQREQIRNLIGMTADKMHRKLEVSNKAKQDLIDAGDDTKKHQQITLEARKAMNAIDYEGAQANKAKAGGGALGDIPEQIPFVAQVTSNGQTKEYDIKNADDLAALKGSKLPYKAIRK